ncbi:hypothetical protein CI102_6701 [Trichoderma harzianum]|nr:hypothetical protein CI102_6701 [Trichoderma harzianum]
MVRQEAGNTIVPLNRCLRSTVRWFGSRVARNNITICFSFSCEIPGPYANDSHLFFLHFLIVLLCFNTVLVLQNAIWTLFSSFLSPAGYGISQHVHPSSDCHVLSWPGLNISLVEVGSSCLA